MPDTEGTLVRDDVAVDDAVGDAVDVDEAVFVRIDVCVAVAVEERVSVLVPLGGDGVADCVADDVAVELDVFVVDEVAVDDAVAEAVAVPVFAVDREARVVRDGNGARLTAAMTEFVGVRSAVDERVVFGEPDDVARPEIVELGVAVVVILVVEEGDSVGFAFVTVIVGGFVTEDVDVAELVFVADDVDVTELATDDVPVVVSDLVEFDDADADFDVFGEKEIVFVTLADDVAEKLLDAVAVGDCASVPLAGADSVACKLDVESSDFVDRTEADTVDVDELEEDADMVDDRDGEVETSGERDIETVDEGEGDDRVDLDSDVEIDGDPLTRADLVDVAESDDRALSVTALVEFAVAELHVDAEGVFEGVGERDVLAVVLDERDADHVIDGDDDDDVDAATLTETETVGDSLSDGRGAGDDDFDIAAVAVADDDAVAVFDDDVLLDTLGLTEDDGLTEDERDVRALRLSGVMELSAEAE